MTTTTMNAPSPDARFWNRIAGYYSRKDIPDVEAYQKKLAMTDSRLKATDKVLEVGCGTGTTALHHAPHVARVVATDISERMIAIARDKAAAAGAENVDFRVESIDALGAASAQYDVIMAHSILHLVGDVPRTLRQLRRMLKPGGLLISNTQCIGDTAPWLGWVAPLGRALRLLPRLNVFREQAFLSWIKQAGFDCEEIWQPKPGASHYIIARAAKVD